MTLSELRERQSWTLEQKIDHSLGTIEAFSNRMGGEDKVYVSFSGGKDSTVLFHLARRIYPNILGVFCNTGNEYPDIIRFVKQTKSEGANVQIIRPKITPREVWAKYGFPLVSKQVSQRIHAVRVNPNTAMSVKYMGDGFFSINKKWRYLVSEPYETSSQCCDKLKKAPFHKFEKESGRSPILGIMACESLQRERLYINRGGATCLNPMAKAIRNRWRYGMNKMFGTIFTNLIYLLRIFTTKVLTGRDASDAGMAATEPMTRDLRYFAVNTQNATTWL